MFLITKLGVDTGENVEGVVQNLCWERTNQKLNGPPHNSATETGSPMSPFKDAIRTPPLTIDLDQNSPAY